VTTYAAALKYIFSANLFTLPKVNLSTMEKLVAYFDHPERSFKSIHIAGTNGKGSTATKIAKGLELGGFRTGLFTSPHISSFRERIQINSALIDAAAVTTFLKDIQKAQHLLGIRASFFELTTMISLLYFAEQKVDWAILEVGLGGRLDATNIILPELSVITSIAIDHPEILGHTLQDITREKGGIIKPLIPVVIGPRVLASPLSAIAQQMNSPLLSIVGDFPTFDAENNAISARAMEFLSLPSPLISRALSIRPACRLEEVRSHKYFYPVLLDVAHNPDGLNALFRSLPERFARPTVIMGLSTSKDITGCLRIASRHAKALYFVQGDSPRGASSQHLAQMADQLGYHSYRCFASIPDALSEASSPVLICGTFFIMAAARAALGLTYPIDP